MLQRFNLRSERAPQRFDRDIGAVVFRLSKGDFSILQGQRGYGLYRCPHSGLDGAEYRADGPKYYQLWPDDRQRSLHRGVLIPIPFRFWSYRLLSYVPSLLIFKVFPIYSFPAAPRKPSCNVFKVFHLPSAASLACSGQAAGLREA